MYHDTIKINFRNWRFGNVAFDYNFLISKNLKDKFSSTPYNSLLSKFIEIGFNIKYLKFNDIEETDIVYCSYNYQSNFDVFFKAYNKILRNERINITFEYGVVINGKFYANNMNTFAGVYFIEYHPNDFSSSSSIIYSETIIKGKLHKKEMEFYQIVDNVGNPIAAENTTDKKDFEQHFFDKYEVKVALRKFKLNRLKLQIEKEV